MDDTEKNIYLVVDSVENIKEKKEKEEKINKLTEKLDPMDAWYAVKDFGEHTYPNFKLHFFKEKYAEDARDENTWFLKAGAEINGLKCYCEAEVSGTSTSPDIESFICYDAMGNIL